MINSKTKAYICKLQHILKWAGNYVPVSKYAELDWSCSDYEALILIKALLSEVEDAQYKLTQLAKQLQLSGDMHQVSQINKVIKTLAKYVDKDDGIQI